MDRGLDQIPSGVELLRLMDDVIEHARSIRSRVKVAMHETPPARLAPVSVVSRRCFCSGSLVFDVTRQRG
jgi:hypothetical protein